VLVASAATVTDEGTVTALLSLLRLTVAPPLGAAALSVTVQVSVVIPVSELLVQVRALAGGIVEDPVPLRSATVLEFDVASLVTVICPVTVPALVGVNCTVRLKVPPDAIVTGSVYWLMIVNDCPVMLIAETVTGDKVLLVSVIVAAAACPTVTDPKARGLGVTVSTKVLLVFSFT
jgi:hypothetical protein